MFDHPTRAASAGAISVLIIFASVETKAGRGAAGSKARGIPVSQQP